MAISLEEAVEGVKKTVRLTKNAPCESCRGTGAKNGTSFTECKGCGGRGEIRGQQGFFTIKQTCPNCRGAGRMVDENCRSCTGRGVTRKDKTLSINVPAGVEDGDRMRVTGEGEAAVGSQCGDLYVDIKVNPHPIFTREGNDLMCDIPISFVTLALGGEVQVPTLGGRVSLKVPEGSASGKVFRLRGKGIKSLRSTGVGDLMVRLSAEVPVKLTGKQREILQQFDQSLQDGGRHHSPGSSSWKDKAKKFFDSL